MALTRRHFTQSALAGLAASYHLPAWAQGQELADPAQSAATKNNEFGADIFARLLAGRGADKNLVFSPYSAAAALHLLAPGAAGDTAKAFAAVLRSGTTLKPDSILARQGVLRVELGQGHDATLLSANGLWAAASARLKAEYIARVKQAMDAELATLPSSGAAGAKLINEWVAAKTKGAIPVLFNILPDGTPTVLVNTLYFKADWAKEFATERTADMPFHRANGDVPVKMMQRRAEDFRYRETQAYQAVQLNYRAERFKLAVVLPKQKGSIAGLAAPSSVKELADYENYKRTPGLFAMPRLNIADAMGLDGALRAAGLDIAFTGKADFSAMADSGMMIGTVLQRTKLEIDEKGTTAAAATGIVMAPTSAPMPQPPFTMICDRPYMLVLHDAQTKAILFMAQIADPVAAA